MRDGTVYARYADCEISGQTMANDLSKFGLAVDAFIRRIRKGRVGAS